MMEGGGGVEAGPVHSGRVCWARLDPCMLCGFDFFYEELASGLPRVFAVDVVADIEAGWLPDPGVVVAGGVWPEEGVPGIIEARTTRGVIAGVLVVGVVTLDVGVTISFGERGWIQSFR